MRREIWIAYGLLTLTALFWSGSVIVARAVAGEVPPMAINFWRWVIAFAVAAPFGLPRVWAARRAVALRWRILAVLGLLNMVVFGSGMFLALQYTEAINGSLVHGTMPINIVLVSWIVLGAALSARQVFGVALGFAGLVLIIARGDAAVIAGLNFNVGDIIMWAAIVAYSLYSIYLPRAPKELDPLALMTVLSLIGVFACLPPYLWETLALGRPMPLNLTALWTIGYVGLFPSLLAQIFWVAAVNRIGAATAGYFIYLSPVFGTTMAIAILGETFAWYHAVGVAAIFAGIYIAVHQRQRA